MLELIQSYYSDGIDWRSTGTMLSGLATVGLAYIACKTYGDWSKREDRKHAISVLSLVIEAEMKFDEIRKPPTVWELFEAEKSLGLKDELGKNSNEKKGINDAGCSLQRRQVEAQVIINRLLSHDLFWKNVYNALAASEALFGEETKNELNRILETYREIRESTIPYSNVEDNDEHGKQIIEKRRNILFRQKENCENEAEKDEIQTRLIEVKDKIRLQLSKYTTP